MENVDRELVLELINSNSRLKDLYKEHQQLDRQAANLERLKGYSTSAALALAVLKKQKLAGMDEIMSILDDYRTSAAA
ncbi:MAG: DUF465 domain-containing protein [bacterium]|nr:DUF465 domain-containing protein [bacterium]